MKKLKVSKSFCGLHVENSLAKTVAVISMNLKESIFSFDLKVMRSHKTKLTYGYSCNYIVIYLFQSLIHFRNTRRQTLRFVYIKS